MPDQALTPAQEHLREANAGLSALDQDDAYHAAVHDFWTQTTAYSRVFDRSENWLDAYRANMEWLAERAAAKEHSDG
jgi:hypothetical protein